MVATDQHDPVAGGRQSVSDGPSHALAGAGDDGDAVAHCPLHAGFRPALNAAWNSAWSSVVISRAWVIASSSTDADIDMSSSRVSSDLVWANASVGPSAMRLAKAWTAPSSSSSGTSCDTRP